MKRSNWRCVKMMSGLVAGAAMMALTSTANGQSKVATVKIKTSIYCDHCKECESCGPRLDKAIHYEKGIKRVDVDQESKTITVVYNPEKTTPDKIRKAIAKVGYDADDVKADAKAYDKLDGCCKK